MSEGTGRGPSPLDAERQRLRAQGYSDPEISQILVARALGGGAGSTGAQAQGVFSNVLSSIIAVANYLGGLFTSIRADIATILDRSALRGARAGAFAATAIKAVVIGALAFAAWQEWRQHIINQTEITELQKKKLQAEADAAKALAEAQVKKLESEAAVSKELNEAQAQKLKAEAGAAEQVAGGAKAQACGERLKLLSQNAYADDMDGDGTVKPGSPTARMIEQYTRDCGSVTGETTPDTMTAGSSRMGIQDAEDVLAKAGKQYQDLKKASMMNKEPFAFDDLDGALDAACLFGIQISTTWKLHDSELAKNIVVNSLPNCNGAAVAYKITQIANMPLDVPADFSKAPDEKTRIFWISKSIASDIKKCVDRGPDYTNFLDCSCMAGARFGAWRVSPDDEQTKQSLIEKTETVCRRMSQKFAELDGPDVAKEYRDYPRQIELVKIDRAEKAGDYATAYSLAKQHAAAVEADEVKATGQAGKKTATVLGGDLAWHALFARKFQDALDACERAAALDPSDLIAAGNRAHALMFLGRTAEANTAYLAHRGESLLGKKWEDVTAEDFAKLRKAGLSDPLMTTIEAAFSSAVPPSPTPAATPSPDYSALATPSPEPSTLSRPADADTYDPLETVRHFYRALGEGDGEGASAYVVPEKRKGHFSGSEMTRFFGAMTEPLRIKEAKLLDGDTVSISYHYRYGSKSCDTTATVTTVNRDGRAFIFSTKAAC